VTANEIMTHDASYRRILHRMGYYNYQQGLIYHHLKEEEGWRAHLRNSRNFILKSLNEVKPSVVTVLGSGWLLDLPLREMADMVSEINLVDIVHPPQVRDQVASMNNVILREEDITGGLIDEVWQKAGRRPFFSKLKSIESIRIHEYNPSFSPGMVVSLNILTQLESLPLELLRKKSTADEQGLLNIRRCIQKSHLSFLKEHRSVLITDLSEIVTDTSGRSREIVSVLADLPRGVLEEEWTWHFDLRDSDFYRRKSIFRVLATLIENGPE